MDGGARMIRWLLLTALVCAAAAGAQTRYVTDELAIELRSGPTLGHRILRNVRAGETVQVLEQDADSGYSRVRFGDEEGWVLSRFLTAEPAARDRLAAAERNLATARGRVTDLEARVADLTTQLGGATQELEQTERSHAQAAAELADIRTVSANAIQLRDRNETLQRALAEREAETERLRAENGALARRERQNWFVVGACVLLGGVIIGLVAPSLRRRRRTDW